MNVFPAVQWRLVGRCRHGPLPSFGRYLAADGFNGTRLASVGGRGATAATSSCCSSSSQVCLAAAHGLASCSHASNSHLSWQDDRRDKNGGRVDDRNTLLQQGAQVRAPDLTVLTL